MKYSLWTVDHESVSHVTLIKEKDTNSSREVDKWMETYGNVASFYRSEDELPADYVQTFQEQ